MARSTMAGLAVAMAVAGCGGADTSSVEAKLVKDRDQIEAQARDAYAKAGVENIAALGRATKDGPKYASASVLNPAFRQALAHIPPRYGQKAANSFYVLIADLGNAGRLSDFDATKLIENVNRTYDLGLGQKPSSPPKGAPTDSKAACKKHGEGFSCTLDESVPGGRAASLSVKVSKAGKYSISEVSKELGGSFTINGRRYPRPY